MKILAFGASTSSTSINRQLAHHAADQLAQNNADTQVTKLDLHTFAQDLPMFSEDAEAQDGIPQTAHEFLEKIQQHDLLVLSIAEHNGSYAAAFKNLYDWASRAEYKVWADKPMLLLSTSPGAGAAARTLETAEATFSRMGAEIKATYSLPKFQDNFTPDQGITNPEEQEKLTQALQQIKL